MYPLGARILVGAGESRHGALKPSALFASFPFAGVPQLLRGCTNEARQALKRSERLRACDSNIASPIYVARCMHVEARTAAAQKCWCSVLPCHYPVGVE